MMSFIYDEEAWKVFWYYVNERQEIWYKRFVLKQSPPWTSDSILKKYKFTNNYRVLDTGTRYVTENIIPYAKKVGSPAHELFVNLIIYRIFNRTTTFGVLGYLKLQNYDEEVMNNKLDSIKKSGNKVFTSAFMVSARMFPETRIKSEKYTKVITWVVKNAKPLYDECLSQETMKECLNVLSSVYGLGRFLAYQIILDAMYAKILKYDENDWSFVVLGAKRGLNAIFPNLKKSEELEAMRIITDFQRNEFKRFGYDFKFLEGKPLSLSNIENCLCEFSKYLKTFKGEGRPRVKFKGG